MCRAKRIRGKKVLCEVRPTSFILEVISHPAIYCGSAIDLLAPGAKECIRPQAVSVYFLY